MVEKAVQIFDGSLLAQREMRRRSIRDAHDFLWCHCAASLQERLLDIKRDFGHVVESSCGTAQAQPYVLTAEFLQQKKITAPRHVSFVTRDFQEQEIMDFPPHSLDGLISLGELQWVNDVPGFLVQAQRSLRPDGLFLGAFFGGDTLHELRDVLAQAEMALYGGVSPRVSPFISLQDMAALMQRAQFALPVVDHDIVTVTYADLKALVTDLRGMGQNNAILKRNNSWRSRKFWQMAEDIYRQKYAHMQRDAQIDSGVDSGVDSGSRLLATVEIIYVLGWAPDPSQPQPLKRGSATHALSDVLKHHQITAKDD